MRCSQPGKAGRSGAERVLSLVSAGVEPLLLSFEVESPLCGGPDYVLIGRGVKRLARSGWMSGAIGAT
jgi:hypothetical protein